MDANKTQLSSNYNEGEAGREDAYDCPFLVNLCTVLVIIFHGGKSCPAEEFLGSFTAS